MIVALLSSARPSTSRGGPRPVTGPHVMGRIRRTESAHRETALGSFGIELEPRLGLICPDNRRAYEQLGSLHAG